MKIVVQRVLKARVMVQGKIVGEIERGLLSLVAYQLGDTADKNIRALEKLAALRIFEDDTGKMNLSLKDLKFGHLIVSQFTLLGDLQRGNRPSFSNAEKPELAKALYDDLCSRAQIQSRELGIRCAFGQFQAEMQVELINDGPVTLILDL